MPAFAYWEGTIDPHTQSAEIVSTMDLLPSLVTIAGGAHYTAVRDSTSSRRHPNLLFWSRKAVETQLNLTFLLEQERHGWLTVSWMGNLHSRQSFWCGVIALKPVLFTS